MTRVLLSTLVWFALSAGVASEDLTAAGATTMEVTASKLLDVPGFGAYGPVHCDSRANLYFHTGFLWRQATILEIRSNGATQVYSLDDRNADPSELVDGESALSFVAFDISSDGNVWVLASGRKRRGLYLYRFSDDPHNPTRTKLEVPEDMEASTVRNFVVMENGHVLIQGYLDESVSKRRQGKGYRIEFDPSGRLAQRHMFELTDSERVAQYSELAAARGDDGLVYLLLPDKVVGILPSGEVSRTIRISPPETGYQTSGFFLHHTQFIVAFSKQVVPQKPLAVRYALFDISTGKQLKILEPSVELGNSAVCFSDEGLTFFRVEKGKVKLLTAAVN